MYSYLYRLKNELVDTGWEGKSTRMIFLLINLVSQWQVRCVDLKPIEELDTGKINNHKQQRNIYSIFRSIFLFNHRIRTFIFFVFNMIFKNNFERNYSKI